MKGTAGERRSRTRHRGAERRKTSLGVGFSPDVCFSHLSITIVTPKVKHLDVRVNFLMCATRGLRFDFSSRRFICSSSSFFLSSSSSALIFASSSEILVPEWGQMRYKEVLATIHAEEHGGTGAIGRSEGAPKDQRRRRRPREGNRRKIERRGQKARGRNTHTDTRQTASWTLLRLSTRCFASILLAALASNTFLAE